MVTPAPPHAPLLTPKALCAQLSICYRTYTRLEAHLCIAPVIQINEVLISR